MLVASNKYCYCARTNGDRYEAIDKFLSEKTQEVQAALVDRALNVQNFKDSAEACSDTASKRRRED